MASIKEKGAPRDQDKLIRQLSLVAYLMARRGRPVKAEEIRQCVEGYDDGTRSQETFARRFYADRDELRGIGIGIESVPDEFGEGDVYRLPAENYFLPQVPFTVEEIAALQSCLYLLDGQFAYSRLLRLALQGLALGTGNSLEDASTDCFSVNLLSSGYDDEVARRQKEIENAISRRKTIAFDYYAISHDKVERRKVDPYDMMLTRGDWYLVGYSHERKAMRIFKLRRIQGRIRPISKNEHNFSIPPEFHIKDYINMEPWQLGPVQGSAVIRFSPRLGWWAKSNLRQSGEIQQDPDGSVILRTDYSDGGQLCSLVLGMHQDARLEEPPELRQQIADALRKIESAHSGPPAFQAGDGLAAIRESAGGEAMQPEAGPARDPESESAREAPQVPPERFALMVKTMAYLLDRLDDGDEISLPVDEVCADLGFEDSKGLEQAMDLLRLVNIGQGGYLIEGYVEGKQLRVSGWPEGETFRRPAHLSPREARAMLLAIDLVGSQLLGQQYESLETAREKILLASGGLDENSVIAVGETEKEDIDICRVINTGLIEHRLVEIEYLSAGAEEPASRNIEPYLLNRVKGEWYLVAWCLKREAIRTFRFSMIKNARLLDQGFEPRDRAALDLDRYTRDPRKPSGKEASSVAEIWFSPEQASWIREQQVNLIELEDGSLISHVPFFSREWLIDEIFKYRGSAVLLSPADVREQIARTAAGLAGEYEQEGSGKPDAGNRDVK